jgi:MFS transporter, FHS family, glucose/mannose:H+ symporter
MAPARWIPVLYAGFVLSGMVTTLLGPLVPGIRGLWALDEAGAGLFFTAQFMGSFVGSTVPSLLLRRPGSLGTVMSGYAVIAAGLALFGQATWQFGLAATFLYGIGLGLVLPATNVLVAAATTRPAAALSALNLAWGAGAALWPLIVGAVTRTSPLTHATVSLAVGCAVIAGVLAPWSVRSIGPGSHTEDAGAAESGAPLPPAVPTALLFGVAFFLYSGSESSLGGWVGEQLRRLGSAETIGWTSAPALFWSALTAGRLAATVVLSRARVTPVLLGSLACAVLGAAVVAGARDAWLLLAGAAIAGLGLAPVFPIMIALMSRDLGTRALRLAGPLFACAGLGGAVLPWLVGYRTSTLASANVAMEVPLVAIVVLLGLLTWHAARHCP